MSSLIFGPGSGWARVDITARIGYCLGQKEVSWPVSSACLALGAGEGGLVGVVGGKFECSVADPQKELPIIFIY